MSVGNAQSRQHTHPRARGNVNHIETWINATSIAAAGILIANLISWWAGRNQETIVSIAGSTAKTIARVTRSLTPHLIMLAGFGIELFYLWSYVGSSAPVTRLTVLAIAWQLFLSILMGYLAVVMPLLSWANRRFPPKRRPGR